MENSKPKHTPGKLNAHEVREGHFIILPEHTTVNTRPIAVLDHSLDGYAPFRKAVIPAYAKLFAVSPELLESAIEALQILARYNIDDDGDQVYQRLEEAIKKSHRIKCPLPPPI